MSTLQEQIAARQKQATEKEIDWKACLVARHLGTLQEEEHSWSASYKDDVFEIVARAGVIRARDGDMCFCGTDVKYLGDVVFAQGGGTITSYVPGAWEEELVKLHARAVSKARTAERTAARKQKTTNAVSEAAERKKWGL